MKIGVIGMVAWELLKSKLLTTLFNSHFSLKNRDSKKSDFELIYNNAHLIFFVFLFLIGSVILSVNGAKEIFARTNSLVSNYDKFSDFKKDSVSTHFDNFIHQKEKELTAYKKSVSWKGSINIANPTNKKVILDLNNEITLLNSDRRAALKQLTQENQKERNLLIEKTTFNTYLIVAFSGINELLILLMLWFIPYYDYKALKEKNTIYYTLFPQSPHINLLQEFYKFISYHGLNQNQEHISSFNQDSENELGFKYGKQEINPSREYIIKKN